MSEESKLLENLMGMLGDNPAEKLGQMLSALSAGESRTEQTEQEASEAVPQAESGFGLDPAMLIKMQSLMGQLNQTNTDDRSALLSAIRPFLSKERQPQVDQAIKFLRLTQLAKTAQDMDLFKDLL